MNAAEPGEFCVLQTGYGAQDFLLRAVAQLGLKPDHVEQGAECIVLAQLHHRMRARPVMGIGQTHWLHGPKPQSLASTLGHHLDGQAAFEIRRVFFPFMEFNLVALDQRINEGLELCFIEGAVDVILARAAGTGFVVARLEPGFLHVDALGMNDRGDGVEKGKVFLAGQFDNRRAESRRGEGARGHNHTVPIFRWQACDFTSFEGDQRMSQQGGGHLLGEPLPVDRKRASGGNLVHIGCGHNQRTEHAHFRMKNADGVVFGIVRSK